MTFHDSNPASLPILGGTQTYGPLPVTTSAAMITAVVGIPASLAVTTVTCNLRVNGISEASQITPVSPVAATAVTVQFTGLTPAPGLVTVSCEQGIALGPLPVSFVGISAIEF